MLLAIIHIHLHYHCQVLDCSKNYLYFAMTICSYSSQYTFVDPALNACSVRCSLVILSLHAHLSVRGFELAPVHS